MGPKETPSSLPPKEEDAPVRGGGEAEGRADVRLGAGEVHRDRGSRRDPGAPVEPAGGVERRCEPPNGGASIGYRPVKVGGRLSNQAVTPSTASGRPAQ